MKLLVRSVHPRKQHLDQQFLREHRTVFHQHYIGNNSNWLGTQVSSGNINIGEHVEFVVGDVIYFDEKYSGGYYTLTTPQTILFGGV